MNWGEYAEQVAAAQLRSEGRQCRVSILAKNKPLTKFGRTVNADTATPRAIANFPDATETYLTANTTLSVVSTSADDDGKSIDVEGHYFNANNEFVFFAETVICGGQTKVDLAQQGCRGNRMAATDLTFASPATNFVGTVYLFASSGVTVTGGVPQTSSSIKCVIAAGKNQSEKLASSISHNDCFFITDFSSAISRGGGASARVDFDVLSRRLGGVFKPIGLELSLSTAAQVASPPVKFEPFRIIYPDSDFYAEATATADNTQISGYVAGVLAQVIDA